MRPTVCAVDDVTWRPITDDDLEAVVAVVDAATAADGLEELLSVEELLERLDGPAADRSTDSRVAVGPDGAIRAWGLVETFGSASDPYRVTIWGGVHPDHRGRGLGRELLAWQVERAGEVRRALAPEAAGVAEAGVPDSAPATEALMARAGFAATRWWISLGQPLGPDLPPVPALPEGVRLAALDEVDDEALRLAFNAAWRDHWGSRQFDAERWEAEMMGSSVLRRDLSRVVVTDAGDVAALLLTDRFPQDDQVRGHAEAWVGTLGTVREWRGRGLASALVRQALHDYRADGLDHAMIGVDADSPSGADGLYRSLGFVEERRMASWTTPLA